MMHARSVCPLTLVEHKLLTLGGGIHTFSHIGETIGLLVYDVSVPPENLISAQQFF
jgi:hypothetical protein